ncbi:MAG: vWA domain-containing protein [Anaerolineales bacterium]
MSFIWPYMLLSLLFVPLLIGLYLRLLQKRKKAASALGPFGEIQDNSGHILGMRRHAPPTLFLVGLALLFFGLSRPEMFVKLPRIEGTVILAFDVSASMTADDLDPTRLEAAKAAARTFVENQPDTIMIGVVAFGNGGLIVQQPTNDQAALLSTFDRLTPQGGTSLGQGIFTSLNAIAGEPLAIDEASLEDGTASLDIENSSSAVIILLTDGENTNNPDPLEIAQLAAESGVRIYPVGIGSREGSVIEVDGFNILTQLNEPMLEEIANLTNGRYYFAEDEEKLQEIYKNIDLQLTVKGEKSEVTSIVAGVSLVFFFIGGALSMIWFGRLP